jgi:hypothetical protein
LNGVGVIVAEFHQSSSSRDSSGPHHA